MPEKKDARLPDVPIPDGWEPKNLAPWWVRARFWLQAKLGRG